MKKNLFITLFLILFFKHSYLIINIVRDTTILFFNKIFISLFPFMILSEILFYFDYHIFLSKTPLGKLLNKLFNSNEITSSIFIFSILSSSPNNAIYIKNMLDNKQINEEEATNILCYTHFPSIIFVTTTIGILIFNDIKIGIILYLNCILNNILIATFLRKNKIISQNQIKTKKESFINTLKNSILKSINNLYIILTTIIIFSIILNILKLTLNLNTKTILLLSSILELSNTINIISNINLNTQLKLLITSFSLNFSTLSILFQSFQILSNYKINIKKILIIKLIFSLITSLSLYILTFQTICITLSTPFYK